MKKEQIDTNSLVNKKCSYKIYFTLLGNGES